MAIKDYLAKLRGRAVAKPTDMDLLRTRMRLSDLAMKHVDDVDDELGDILARHPNIIRDAYIKIIKEEFGIVYKAQRVKYDPPGQNRGVRLL